MLSLAPTPVVALFASGLVAVTQFRRSLPVWYGFLVDGLLGLFVYWKLPQPSIVPFWGLATSIVTKGWPILVVRKNNNTSMILRILVHGGPLGRGCKKLVEVLVAVGLWRWIHKSWPSMTLLPLPGLFEWAMILALSGAVNVVLHIWSTTMNSRGDHDGVNDMVAETQNRKLSLSEHVQIFGLAMLNGACEEVTSRWFWRREFATYLSGSEHYSNLAQATLFGIWHYHGIPSGWTGVALTLVYGYIMGFLQDYQEGGLFLPIVAHGIADYYIFAIIARQKRENESDHRGGGKTKTS